MFFTLYLLKLCLYSYDNMFLKFKCIYGYQNLKYFIETDCENRRDILTTP